MPKPVRKMQKANAAAQAAILAKIPPELLDQLVKGPMTAEAVEENRDIEREVAAALISGKSGRSLSRLTAKRIQRSVTHEAIAVALLRRNVGVWDRDSENAVSADLL